MQRRSRIDDAIVFAAEAHSGQVRKGTTIPYITHPFSVAMLLQEVGCGEDVVIAGLLHDTVEDTDVTLDDVKARYGERVAELVNAASEPNKAAPWKERKEHTIEFVANAPVDVKCLSCADKLHNIRSILSDLEKQGCSLWERFNRGRDEQLWYYTALLQSFYRNLPVRHDQPLFASYRHAVVELRTIVRGGIGAGKPGQRSRDRLEMGRIPAWEDGEMAVRAFAQDFDGYVVFGGKTVLWWLYEVAKETFRETGAIPLTFTLEDVYGCLFVIQRIWHAGEQSGTMELSDEFVQFVKALLDAIRSRN